MSRKGPEKSATLYKVGTKKKGNDNNIWIIKQNKNGINKWVLFRKSSTKSSTKSAKESSIKSFSNFTKFDYYVFDIINHYKSTYELIINKSLEYKINIQNENFSSDITKVTYEKISKNAKKIKSTMCLFGQLNKNTFTWNNHLRLALLNTRFNEYTKDFRNKKIVESLKKLFSYNKITFPVKYRQIIPYFISFNLNPKNANIIRFIDENESNKDIFTYILIYMSLDIPYWFKMTQHIYDDLTLMKGGNIGDKEEVESSNMNEDNISHKNKLFVNYYM